MENENMLVNYPDHVKRKDPVINLPFYKTDEVIANPRQGSSQSDAWRLYIHTQIINK